MSDVILIGTIVAFFVVAALLVRACGHITDRALSGGETDETPADLDRRQRA